MILEFLKPFGNWKVGDITDQVSEGVGRALITQGDAKESTEAAQLRALLVSETTRTREEMLDLARTSLGAKPAPKGPAGGKELVDSVTGATRIDHTASAGKRCMGEALKAVFYVQAQGTPGPLREWAQNLLDKEYAQERVNYKVTDDGQMMETIERNGVTVTRTGTESISGGPTYGFSIKPDWSNTMFKIPIEASVMEGSCYEVPVGNALEFKWPALDQYKAPIAGQSAAYAGFQLFRKGEITQRTYSDAALSMIEYKITDLTAFTTLSRDLVADSYLAIDAVCQQVLGDAFQWKKDYEFINGLGIGSPTGFLNSNAALTVTRNTANHIVYEDLVAMMKQIHSSCWNGLRWITNTQTLSELVAIKNAAGTYVYQPNSLIAQYMRPTVMKDSTSDAQFTMPRGWLEGIPVYFTEKLPTLGTKGDLCLIHPKSYGVATRSGLEVGLSEHFLFDTDTIAYRFKLRNDAKPLWRAPYIQSDGGNTTATKVGPFSVLV